MPEWNQPTWMLKHKLSTEEYEAEMDRRGENYFNSRGEYIENTPPREESDAEVLVGGSIWLVVGLVRLAITLGLIAAAVMGLIWLFGD